MTSESRTVSIGAHPLTHGGVLLTINGTRRVAVPHTIDTVRQAFRGDETPGFLGQLGQLVRQAGDTVATSVDAVGKVVVRADEDFLAGPCRPVIEAFCASFAAVEVALSERSTPPTSVGPGDLVVSMHQHFDFQRLTAIEDEMSRTGARWAPFWREPAGARFGPYRDDENSPTVRDLAARWVTAAFKDAHGRALLKPPAEVVQSTPVTPIELAYEVGVFLHDVALWIGGGRPRAWWHTVHLDRGGGVGADPVLPLPDRQVWVDPAGTGLSPMDVVNPSVGIVRRLRDVRLRTPMPAPVRFVESQTADMARLRPWAANIYNAGSSWGDEDRARAGAVGEAVERYCGNYVDFAALQFGSFDELSRRGVPALDPRELVLFSDEQYADARFPFVRLDRSTRTHWVSANSLVDEREVLVPASVTFVNWNAGRALFSPRTNPAYYPGIAAGPTRAAALANALEEVVERDAAMVWWWSGHRLPTSGRALDTVDALMPGWQEELALHVGVTPLTNAVGVPTMAVTVDARRAGLLTMGLAARWSPDEAIKKALLEALGLVETALDMQDPQGGFWQTYQPGERSGAVLPVRADRRYLDAYRGDFRDVTDLFCQLQIQLDPRSRDIVCARFGDPDDGGSAGVPGFPERDHRAYVGALAHAGFEPLAVDLTTSDVAAAGWHAVRVIVPGLVPNFPTAFPPLGRGRLVEQPVALGWAEAPRTEHDLWTFPMPYA